MNILFLTHDIPFPVNNGSRMRTWSFIKALSKDHKLHLLCFEKNWSENASSELLKYCKHVWTVETPEIPPKSLNRLQRWITTFKDIVMGIPQEISITYSRPFEKRLQELIIRYKYDFVFARYLRNGQFLLRNKKLLHAKTVIDLDDIAFIKSERSMQFEDRLNFYANIRKRLNLFLLKKYHTKLNAVTTNIVCSESDRDILQKQVGLTNVSVIPNTINVSDYNVVSSLTQNTFDRKIILFCGTLNYDPNIDGIEWFVNKVFPMIKKRQPTAKCYIVGQNPINKILDLADNQSISVFSNVESVIPYYEQSTIVIVPIRMGGGTRIKILEALACRRPIVSTQIGAEGLHLTNKIHGFIEDSPDKFAKLCLDILQNYNLAAKVADAGFSFVKNNFDAMTITEKITQVFDTVPYKC